VSDHFRSATCLHEAHASLPQRSRTRLLTFSHIAQIGIFLWTTAGCTSTFWQPFPVEEPPQEVDQSLSSILDPNPEDMPFFEAIGEEQDKKLQRCHNDEECSSTLFLRAVAALYVNQELAAHHFRRVVVAKPNSQLASESRFWLWVLEVLKSPENPSPTSGELAKRFAREMVDRELMVHELVSKLDKSSVEALQQDLNHRDKKIEELNLLIVGLTKQVDQLKKGVAVRHGLQQELKAREKKVQELMSQLEALRRIDQDPKEKTLPTRPSEKMTPSPEMETEIKEESKKTNGG
jgi:TolA-binding protein